MLLRGAVAKVETKNIDARPDKLGDDVVRITSGSDSGDDLGSSDDLWVHVDFRCWRFNPNTSRSKSRLCTGQQKYNDDNALLGGAALVPEVF